MPISSTQSVRTPVRTAAWPIVIACAGLGLMAATTVAVACGWTVWSVATVAAPATTVEQVVDWLDLPPNHGVRLLSHAIDVGTAATAWMVSERAAR